MWNYPKTRQEIVTDEMHGRKIDDPYRWLEDSDSSAVLAWSEAQNRFARQTLDEARNPQEFKAELKELFAFDAFSLPVERDGWYYWSERKSGENQSSVYRRHGLDGEPELVLDANALSADGTVTIASWNVSFGGRYFDYSLSEKGSERGSLYIRDLTSDDPTPIEEIPHVRKPSLVWASDEKSFYFTRHPVPGTVPVVDEQYYGYVYYHVVGTPWQEDRLVFGEGRHKEDGYGLDFSTDRQQIIIGATRNWVRNELYVLDVATNEISPVVEGIDARFGLDIINGRAYLYTNYEAEFGRVLTCDGLDLPKELDGWREFIPERPGKKLASFVFTAEILIVRHLVEGESLVEILDHDGTFLRKLELPPLTNFLGIVCRENRDEYFYAYTSYLEPTVQYRCANADSAPELYREIEKPEDVSRLTVSKEYATSKDGTRIPVALVHAKDVKLDGSNPTVLYGYGGFNTVLSPTFVRGMLPFIRRGGVYAVAIIRGGGEGGSEWHKAGILERKQNTFDDFIAAAEALIARGYTKPEKLAIFGGSNGGLLVGACATQRPDLYRAIVCRVPLLDMVRFPQFLIASRWMSEYGDPAERDDFERIMTWSPYHNVKSGVPYPSWLIMTGDHDTRVEPLHARKMAALLQSRGDDRPILIRTEIDAGHGAGTPVSKWVDAQADILAYLAWQLDM